MTKEQIAAIAVVLLFGAVFFVRLYRRQQELPTVSGKNTVQACKRDGRTV